MRNHSNQRGFFGQMAEKSVFKTLSFNYRSYIYCLNTR